MNRFKRDADIGGQAGMRSARKLVSPLRVPQRVVSLRQFDQQLGVIREATNAGLKGR